MRVHVAAVGGQRMEGHQGCFDFAFGQCEFTDEALAIRSGDGEVLAARRKHSTCLNGGVFSSGAEDVAGGIEFLLASGIGVVAHCVPSRIGFENVVLGCTLCAVFSLFAAGAPAMLMPVSALINGAATAHRMAFLPHHQMRCSGWNRAVAFGACVGFLGVDSWNVLHQPVTVSVTF